MHSGFHMGGLPGKPGPRPEAPPPVACLLPQEA